MQYWLMKTEPDTYSWDDLVRDTANKGGEKWSGVRNYEARNNMRKMAVGDLVFIYHSVGDREIVGIASVVGLAHHDSTDDTGTWDCVTVAAVRPVQKVFTLEQAKASPQLTHMTLVTRGRLSVQPVTSQEWHYILTQI